MKEKLVRGTYVDKGVFLSHMKSAQKQIVQNCNQGSVVSLETRPLLGFRAIVLSLGFPFSWSPRGPRWLLELSGRRCQFLHFAEEKTEAELKILIVGPAVPKAAGKSPSLLSRAVWSKAQAQSPDRAELAMFSCGAWVTLLFLTLYFMI